MTAPGALAHSRAFARYFSKDYLNKHYLAKNDLKMKKDHLFLLIPLAFLALLAWQSPAMPASDGGDDGWGDDGWGDDS